MHLTDTTICGLASDALALELENKPGLVSKVILIVVARGDVVNEACQKVIGFYGPDSQVRGDLEIDASTKDRKSTRLNSSHTVISYAVFCLKKKKKKKKEQKN